MSTIFLIGLYISGERFGGTEEMGREKEKVVQQLKVTTPVNGESLSSLDHQYRPRLSCMPSRTELLILCTLVLYI